MCVSYNGCSSKNIFKKLDVWIWKCFSDLATRRIHFKEASSKFTIGSVSFKSILKEVHILGIQELVILSELHSAALCLVCVT